MWRSDVCLCESGSKQVPLWESVFEWEGESEDVCVCLCVYEEPGGGRWWWREWKLFKEQKQNGKHAH